MASDQAWLRRDCTAVSVVSWYALWAQLAKVSSCQCLCPSLLLRELSAQSIEDSRTMALSIQSTHRWSRNLSLMINATTYLIAQEYFHEDFIDCDSRYTTPHSFRSTVATGTSYTESISLKFSAKSLDHALLPLILLVLQEHWLHLGSLFLCHVALLQWELPHIIKVRRLDHGQATLGWSLAPAALGQHRKGVFIWVKVSCPSLRWVESLALGEPSRESHVIIILQQGIDLRCPTRNTGMLLLLQLFTLFEGLRFL